MLTFTLRFNKPFPVPNIFNVNSKYKQNAILNFSVPTEDKKENIISGKYPLYVFYARKVHIGKACSC